jgi:hypothetical protein
MREVRRRKTQKVQIMTDTPKADVSAAGQIAKELRAGLDGVTPGPWALFRDKGPPRMSAVMPAMRAGDVCVITETSIVDPDRVAAHIARCSPDRLTILLDEFEERGREIERLNAKLNVTLFEKIASDAPPLRPRETSDDFS